MSLIRCGKAVQLVKQAGHTVGKLLGGGGTVSKTGIGLKLTGNAAHILAPLDGAGVGALGNLTGLQSGNAAHVVADVLVSHRPVLLQPRWSRGKSGNAADIVGVPGLLPH